MAVPVLSISSSDPTSTAAEVLVLGVRKTADGPRLAVDGEAFPAVTRALTEVAATGGVDELRRLPALDGTTASIALIGLGSGEITIDSLRYAAGSAARQLTGIERLAIALPVTSGAEALAVLEGAAIGAYAYTGYRVTTIGTTKTPADDIVVHLPADVADDAQPLVDRATTVATAIHTVRDLVNTPPSDLYPETLAAAAVDAAQGLPLEVEVLDETELEAGGYGGILAVGRGSVRPPRLVVVRYSPAEATRHLALVGKGITFDSGGLSLKPPAGMVGMKYDMTGAVTALAVVVAAARLALPVRLTAWLCIAENMPSGSAARPNDVLRMRGGTTVEVLNTDAEGRLVLADGLVAASEEEPDAIVDVATLTGAARVAMGERYTPVMGDDEMVQKVVAAGAAVGEVLWPMPMPPELRSLLDSDVADIANAKPGNTAGGMLIAAHFLRAFVGSTGEGAEKRSIPWAHLDIAGVANNPGSPHGGIGKGPTGTTVRTLLRFAEDFSAS
ncbi:leucyl aminopeptidase [Pseudolysinimonas yzui]|uniref:Probable cytosol aminopeptidase n=1 Tax=Pseudolysinimonas yzui TaxID=2708254 RepID=A0A8J3GNP9_9MICO|nr:leucyl aminopeptidase [Pseudolysinimonas yzui]GHF08288.1 putative cytosol aminopeptidase [Pseudolysinimonas yzui]